MWQASRQAADRLTDRQTDNPYAPSVGNRSDEWSPETIGLRSPKLLLLARVRLGKGLLIMAPARAGLSLTEFSRASMI